MKLHHYVQETRMLDATDSRLLALIQSNAMMTAQELGDYLNLSPSQAARRRQRLEAEGFVTGYGAKLDPARLGLSVQAFVQVQMASHAPDVARSFGTLIAALPELIHDRLLPHPAVSRVQSQIVMDQLKTDAPLPT
jgi:DNA-binding Lrp family transcriptional regulator